MVQVLRYVDYVNYLAAHVIPPDLSRNQLKKFFSDVKHYHWKEPILYKHCADQVLRRCVPEEEMNSILDHCHSLQCGGIFQVQERWPKYFNVDSFGQIFFEMPMVL